jgi:hypothetical protein
MFIICQPALSFIGQCEAILYIFPSLLHLFAGLGRLPANQEDRVLAGVS